MIEQEFVYNELESLGFFEWLSETHNLKDTDVKPEYLDKLPLDDIHRTVCNSMALRWFREKCDLHAVIMPKTTPSNTTVYYVYKGKFEEDWNNCFETYEEAELACLRRLIKLTNEEPTDSKGIS